MNLSFPRSRFGYSAVQLPAHANVEEEVAQTCMNTRYFVIRQGYRLLADGRRKPSTTQPPDVPLRHPRQVGRSRRLRGGTAAFDFPNADDLLALRTKNLDGILLVHLLSADSGNPAVQPDQQDNVTSRVLHRNRQNGLRAHILLSP